MSFPADIQHVFDLIVKLKEDHGITYMTIRTSRIGSKQSVVFKGVEITTEVGDLNLKGSGSESEISPTEIGNEAREAVRRLLESVESSRTNRLNELKRAEKGIASCKERAARLHAMIPSPLIELAKCAPEESEIAQ